MIDSRSSSGRLIPASSRLVALTQEAHDCRACSTMEGQPHVLSDANGPVPCAIMLVGEAPGRLGASRSGVPFSGDESGRRFERLLAAAGWERNQVFVTNAVICGPVDAQGRNRTPTASEVTRCSRFLSRQVNLVDPVLVVAMGAVALRALALVSRHQLMVRDAVHDPLQWYGRWLAAAYHPGARAAVHRSFVDQLDDFRRLGTWLAGVNGETGVFQ
jgi:uracil-DNA glycosylase family 4